ncbi:MAG: choice-of-anchor P family protein [Streptosporangiaceae bacterium]
MTGAAAAAGGLAPAATLPAAAASPNRAYAASASGLVGQSPLGEATFPGTSPVTIASASITGLLTTGAATATAGPTSASEVVHNISGILSVLARLTASSVTSSCSFNTNTGLVTGTAGITNGQVTRPGSPTTTLTSNPSPNTKITLAGLAAITLNRQAKASDGTLTVTAIFVSLLGSTQRLSLGVSVCNAANLAPVPILPGMALPTTLGGLVLLLAAAAAYQLSRRRRLALAR